MSTNIFLREPDYYQRAINPLKHYVEQTSFYLHKLTQRPIKECQQHVVASIKGPGSQAIDPTVHFYERHDQTDKERSTLSLTQYINSLIQEESVLAPTFTTYLNESQSPSILGQFLFRNVKKRGMAKKRAFKAKAEKNMLLFLIENNEQENMKRYNNSMSGSFATDGSVLHNPTAHSTLTSITRSVSSIGNASNEKLIAGNRHYFNPDVTLNNLISIVYSANHTELAAVIERYQLVYPTVEDVIHCVHYSSDLYWRDPNAFKRIEDFIQTLTPIERAAFVYIGDLYHIRHHNPEFIRCLLNELAAKVHDASIEDPDTVINSVDEQIVNYVHSICMTDVRGIGKDYSKITRAQHQTLAATCKHVEDTIVQYKDFFEAFFLTPNTPASTAHIPNMIRRAVVLSDTDSTMFSVDEYVQWYFGDIRFTDEAFGIAGAVMFIATQCIAHLLAIFSANINVARDKLFMLAMKPEFCFPVFVQTSVAKHYYASIAIKEGNVYESSEMEIKGIWLKNSASPTVLIKDAQANMEAIVTSVMANSKISLEEYLDRLIAKEQMIKASLLNNEVEFYSHSRIKDAQAYSDPPDRSPYLHHTFWLEVFQPDYPISETPPYTVIKIPTTLKNTTAIKNWIESIEHKPLAQRLAAWIAKHNKTSLLTMYVSDEYVKAFGIPAEIKQIINVKSIVLNLTITDRMVLESLGYFIKVDHLLSEL